MRTAAASTTISTARTRVRIEDRRLDRVMRDLNFKYLAEGKGATVTARFGKDGITLCDPNRAIEKVSVPAIGDFRGCAFLLEWRVSPPCRGSPHHLRHRRCRRQGARPELQIPGRRRGRDRHRPLRQRRHHHLRPESRERRRGQDVPVHLRQFHLTRRPLPLFIIKN
ncbi:MAG: hypothetical protein FJ392_05110 [Verrucomicrobia bacterium]|nr:hypothetical protein [Verrucomicrobiota bacterium]